MKSGRTRLFIPLFDKRLPFSLGAGIIKEKECEFIGINFGLGVLDEKVSVKGIVISLIGNKIKSGKGIVLGLVGNGITEKFAGILGGLINTVENGEMKGVSIGVVNAAKEKISGISIGGIIGGNYQPRFYGVAIGVSVGNPTAPLRELKGISVSVGFNIAEKIEGLVVGLFNIAIQKMRGIAVGLLNAHKTSGSIGFLSFLKK